jgi:hypothetical protein
VVVFISSYSRFCFHEASLAAECKTLIFTVKQTVKIPYFHVIILGVESKNVVLNAGYLGTLKCRPESAGRFLYDRHHYHQFAPCIYSLACRALWNVCQLPDSGHPVSCSLGTKGCFPEVKKPGCESDHSPPSTVHSESRCALIKTRSSIERTRVSKNWIKQLHTLPVLHFIRCLTTEYSETTAHFNGNFGTDYQTRTPWPKCTATFRTHCNTEVKNERSFTSIPPYAFMACRGVNFPSGLSVMIELLAPLLCGLEFPGCFWASGFGVLCEHYVECRLSFVVNCCDEIVLKRSKSVTDNHTRMWHHLVWWWRSALSVGKEASVYVSHFEGLKKRFVFALLF